MLNTQRAYASDWTDEFEDIIDEDALDYDDDERDEDQGAIVEMG